MLADWCRTDAYRDATKLNAKQVYFFVCLVVCLSFVCLSCCLSVFIFKMLAHALEIKRLWSSVLLCLSVSLSVCFCVCLPLYLSVSVWMLAKCCSFQGCWTGSTVCLFFIVSLSVLLSVCLIVCLSYCLSVLLSVCLIVCLSYCLSVWLICWLIAPSKTELTCYIRLD